MYIFVDESGSFVPPPPGHANAWNSIAAFVLPEGHLSRMSAALATLKCETPWPQSRELKNDGTGTKARRHYDVSVARKGQFAKVLSKPSRKARVEDWPSNSYSIWRLVLRALGKAFPEDAGVEPRRAAVGPRPPPRRRCGPGPVRSEPCREAPPEIEDPMQLATGSDVFHEVELQREISAQRIANDEWRTYLDALDAEKDERLRRAT